MLKHGAKYTLRSKNYFCFIQYGKSLSIAHFSLVLKSSEFFSKYGKTEVTPLYEP